MAAYLDNAATTKPCPEAIAAMMEAMESTYGNPSSLHSMGLQAQLLMEDARKRIAGALACEPNSLIFTSGATESNNLAILGAAAANGKRRRRAVVTTVEHASVRNAFDQLEAQGFEVIRITPNAQGEIDPDAFVAAVDENTCIASMMLVNNETGAILPVRRALYAAKRKYPHLITHCDAVQGFMKLPFKVSELTADLISVSAHKIHGVKGVGALYQKKGVRIAPLMFGGEQEHRLRPGTESVPLIAAFGAAVTAMKASGPKRTERIRMLREDCIRRLQEIKGIVLQIPADSSPYILSVAAEGLRAETLLHFLAEHDVYVSSGSACSKGKPSGVLRAFGIPDALADSTIRLSFCPENTLYDNKRLAELIVQAQQQLIHKA